MSSQLDLVIAVLEELGVRDPGQPVAAEDQEIILRRIGPKIAELNNREVAYIADTDDIADDYFLPLVKIMAAECATAFGVIGERFAQVAAYGSPNGPAERALKDAVRLRSTMQTMRIDRFWRAPWGRAR